MRIPVAVHSTEHPIKHLSAQQVKNFYFEPAAADGKMRGILLGTPGATEFVDLPTSPIRGMAFFQGAMCVVAGDRFYTVDVLGNYTNQGGVTGSGAVGMVGSPTQLAIHCGTTSNDLYVWDGSTLSAVSDPDFFGAVSIDYQDGYLIGVIPNSGRFAVSNLNDFTAWEALDFANAEGAPDLTLAVASVHRELWLFGESTTEIWYNSGNADFPFERNQGAFLDRGVANANSVAKGDNSVFWLANDFTVRRAEGFVPRKISTHAMERTIRTYADPSDVTAFVYSLEGHEFYVLNFPEATWVYDMATGLWHQRESYLDTRWLADNAVEAFGKLMIGDYNSGKVLELSSDVYTEDGNPILRTAASAPVHGNGQKVSFGRVEYEVDFGQGLNTGQGSDPQLMLKWSDDGGYTWSNELWRSMGKMGEYGNRCIFNRLGSAYSRVFQVQITDPVRVGLIAFNPDA